MNRLGLIVRAGLLAALIAIATVAIVRQRGINTRLQAQVRYLQRNEQEAPRLRAENRRLREAVARGDQDEAARVLQQQIERERQNVAAWERRLQQQEHTVAAGDTSANRDPEKGMVRIEHFQNVGRASPAAAFQTAIWAAAQGNFAEAAKGFALSPTGRVLAQDYLEKLPPETRARFPTPEMFIAVPFAHDFGDEEGFQIAGKTEDGSGRVVLRVRRLKNGIVQPGEKKIPFEAGPNGWQMVIPDEAVKGTPDYLAAASLEIRPRPKK